MKHLAKILLFATITSFSLFYSCKDDDVLNQSNNTETLFHNGVTREYILHVPAIYDGNSAVPLMFNFHGFGGSASDHLRTTDMRPLANSENFILVYPQGTLLDGFPHWNAGLPGPDNKSDAEDFDFIRVLIQELSSNYNIDSTRIYACGYSNGAFFSYALACFQSDLIAAIGSVSGTMIDETLDSCNCSHPLAMINLHGTSDNTVPYNGGQGLKSIDEVMNYWVNFNNTDSIPTMNSQNNIEHNIYPNGDNDVSVEHFKILGGNHLWFDINYQGANTSQLIWDFVSRYDINGLR